MHEDGFEDALQRRYRIIWWSTLIAPVVLTAVVLGILFAVKGIDYVKDLVVLAVATFFAIGRFVILGGHDAATQNSAGFGSYQELFLMVIFLDLLTAMLLTFHMGFLFKLPILGSKLKMLSDDGRMIIKKYPWMRQTTIAGVMAFVMFPLAATGSIGGSILGRMLGLSRLTTFASVMAGSFLGCGVMYIGASLINEYLDRENPVIVYGGICIIVMVIFFLNYRYQKMKSQRRAELTSERNSE